MGQLKTALGLAGAGAFAFLVMPAHAQDSQTTGTTFKLEGRVGAEYNSNVNVADLDQSTGQDDWAATIDLLAEVQLIPIEKLTLRGGYNFTQSLHQDFDAFDLTIHRPYAEIAYDFDFLTVGVLGNYAQANLDGDEYLTFTQVSPYISKQFGNAFFLRGAYAHTEKEFDGRPTRDATQESGQVDAYIFLDGVNRYVVLGAKGAEEDAVDPELDFSSATGRIRFTQKLGGGDNPMTLKLGAEYEARDYENITASIGEQREDKRTVLDAELEIPFGKNLFSEISYKYGKYDSNFAAADYNEHVGAIKIGVRY